MEMLITGSELEETISANPPLPSSQKSLAELMVQPQGVTSTESYLRPVVSSHVATISTPSAAACERQHTRKQTKAEGARSLGHKRAHGQQRPRAARRHGSYAAQGIAMVTWRYPPDCDGAPRVTVYDSAAVPMQLLPRRRRTGAGEVLVDVELSSVGVGDAGGYTTTTPIASFVKPSAAAESRVTVVASLRVR